MSLLNGIVKTWPTLMVLLAAYFLLASGISGLFHGFLSACYMSMEDYQCTLSWEDFLTAKNGMFHIFIALLILSYYAVIHYVIKIKENVGVDNK